MIIRWQSKSRLVGSFQQINAVARSIAIIITAQNSEGLTYLANNAKPHYLARNNKIHYLASGQ